MIIIWPGSFTVRFHRKVWRVFGMIKMIIPNSYLECDITGQRKVFVVHYPCSSCGKYADTNVSSQGSPAWFELFFLYSNYYMYSMFLSRAKHTQLAPGDGKCETGFTVRYKSLSEKLRGDGLALSCIFSIMYIYIYIYCMGTGIRQWQSDWPKRSYSAKLQHEDQYVSYNDIKTDFNHTDNGNH